MKHKKEIAREAHALKEADAKLKKARKERKRNEQVLVVMVSAKSFSLPMLGQGRKNGVAQQHQKNRHDVLERVREVAELSPEQTCQWTYFKLTWDQQMAEIHWGAWGGLSAEIIRKLLGDLLGGKADVLSVFVGGEKKRVLGAVSALVLPAAPSG